MLFSDVEATNSFNTGDTTDIRSRTTSVTEAATKSKNNER